MVTIAGICAEAIRVLVSLTRPFSDYLLDFLYCIFMGKTTPLPPIENRILLMTAAELAERIRKKQLSCEEVMRAYVDRCRTVHPYINAVVDERYEDAISDAQEVDRTLAKSHKSDEQIAQETPLLGVPFTCKEAIGVKGMTQTSGLVRARGRLAEEDSDTVMLYRKAGAIPVTVTDVPELCMWWESSNHLFGLTKNPYDVTRTVGGSSGGEGAVITAGGALIGIGNDIAGSIRIPSSFCGIYGHKPSRGVISNYSTYPFKDMTSKEARIDDFCSTGPMCRYAQDLPLLVKVLSNSDKRIQFNKKVDFKKVKVYYMEEFPGLLNAAVPDVKKSVKKAVNYFEEQYSVKAKPLRISELKYAFYIWECKLLEYDADPFSYYMAGNGSVIHLVAELFKNLFRQSDHTLPAIYFGMVDRRKKDDFYHFCLKQYDVIERKLAEIFREDAILLIPTHPEPPPHYLMTIPMYPNIAYTCIFNILGLPSTQIPAGMSKGVPIGIQAISGMYKDHITIATALELDKLFQGWKSP